MVLKNNRPLLESLIPDVPELSISTQAGQETMTLLLAAEISAYLGAT